MSNIRRAARWLPLGAALVLCATAIALAGRARPSWGQTGSATPAPGPEQPIANANAVRLVLPSSIRDAGAPDKLPVFKWSRADMYGTGAGHIIFITTIYPAYESDGTRDDRLIADFLTWDGAEWTPQLVDDAGVVLTGDNAWLAENLTDISAYPTAPGAAFTGFTVTYSAAGQYASAVTREETVAAVYDLTPTQVWSRVTHLKDVDSSNAGWVATHQEDADWSFKSVNGQTGIVANVTDTDTIVLDGTVAPDAAPPAGTTSTTSTESYVLGANGFVSLTPGGAPPQLSGSPAATPAPGAASSTPAVGSATAGPSTAAGSAAATVPATATPPPASPTLCAAPNLIFPVGTRPIPTCGPQRAGVAPVTAVPAVTTPPPATATAHGTPVG
jgi:hypothetical protein